MKNPFMNLVSLTLWLNVTCQHKCPGRRCLRVLHYPSLFLFHFFKKIIEIYIIDLQCDHFCFTKFYWSVIDLQCDSFCCTTKWFSYMCTHVHSFSDSLPIQIITEHWVEFSVLYRRSLLANHSRYLSVHMPMPTPPSIFLSPHLSSLVTVKFLKVCDSVPLCFVETGLV